MTLARALVNEPAFLCADEPTGVLDSATATELLRLLRELNAQAGLTKVMVTHDPGVGEARDRIVQMRDGLIIVEERPEMARARHLTTQVVGMEIGSD